MPKLEFPKFIAATMPPPQQWEGKFVWRDDLKVYQYSNGTAWLDLSPSAIANPFSVTARLPDTPARAFLTGDSISSVGPYGTGVNLGEMYASLLIASTPSVNWVQCGVANGGVNSYWAGPLMSADLSSTDVVLGLHGFNDMRRVGAGAPVMNDVERSLEAFYAWCALPASSKVKAAVAGALNPVVGVTGAWTAWGAFAGGHAAAYANANGASQTYTVTGDTVYIFYAKQGGGSGVFTVSIDGVLVAELSTACSFSADGTGNPAGYTPMVYRIRGLSLGQHTVVVTLVAAQVVAMIGVGGFTAGAVAGPTVLGGNVLRMNAAGYATAGAAANDPAVTADGPAWMKGDGGVVEWNRRHRAAIDSLRADGLRVLAVDLSRKYEPTSQVTADNIHPKASWHRVAFREFKALLDQLRVS